MILSSRELLVALAIFALLAVAFSWPLAPNITHDIVITQSASEAMNHLYGLTWGTHALANYPHRYFQATFLYPYPSSLAFMEHLFGLAVLAAPVNWISGNMILGYNVAWLLTFVFAGLGAYLLARYLTESRTAALLAGVLFAFHPFRYETAGQINVLAVMWIPFALLCLHLWVETRLRRQLFLFLGFAFLQFLSSATTGILLMVAGVLYIVVLLFTERESTLELLSRQRWVILTVIAMGFLAAVPFATPYLNSADRETAYDLTLDQTLDGSARPVDFITPTENSVLGSITPWREHARYALFPGLLGLGFAVWFVGRRGWRHAQHRPELIFYLVLGGAGMLLALGPSLGRIPLPFTAVWYTVPGASFMHIPARFITLAILAGSVLAAGGLALVLRPVHEATRRRLLGGVIALVAGLELMATPVDLMRPLPRHLPQVYAWLATLPGPFAILELPMPAEDGPVNEDFARYQLYSLIHGKRLANGVAAAVPQITRDLRREMQLFPGNASVARLRELGITYVLVHSDLMAPEEAEHLRTAILEHPGLQMVKFEGPIWVLDVIPVDPSRSPS